ncbi:crotonase/enoyl-CoA hydratase family protein [uncultured Jatrophihabitans sp.]|uniref:crotonase/enoyl-CoA hydratase family protein n=1 Tax=uncultured Jatrophihabitans sp. TaxID=1610747 RepID=UPI0035CAD4B6
MSVRIADDGPVRVIVIDRPAARNAVNGPTAAALADAFRAFDVDDSVAVAVLCGADGTFCAGADLKLMSNPLNPQLSEDAPMGPSRLRLGKPVIAAVEGHAVAGGMELAAWCDLRVLAADAVVGVFCRRWGVPLIDGGTVRLPRLIGLGRALDLILTGRAVGAGEALAMGFANRVVPSGTAVEHAVGLAHELATLPQTCLRSDRASVYEALGHDESDALAVEFDHGSRALRADASAGAQRFAGGAGRHGSPG